MITHIILFRKPYGSSQQSNTVVMIHDAFQSISYWKDFMASPSWEGVILDTHIYQMFSMNVSLTIDVKVLHGT